MSQSLRADASAEQQIDASLESITNFDNLYGEPEPAAETVARGADGKFTPRKEAAADEAAPDAVDAKDDGAGDKGDEKAADDVAEDEDYIELPPEAEGQEPTKLKLSEAIASHKRAAALEAELAEIKKSPAIAPAAEQQIEQTMQTRRQYIAGVEQLMTWLKPQWPSRDMVNPNSPAYDPEKYHALLQQAEQVQDMHQRAAAERDRVGKEQAREQAVLREARIQREWAAALQTWPELKDAGTRKGVVDYLSKAGYSEQEIDNVSARDLSVVKKARAYDELMQRQKTAVKVVTAKPKLVRGQARQTVDAPRQRASTHLERLSKTGSLDDAVNSLAELL